MVGPWQVPVADCAITLADFQRGFAGEAMSHGRAHAIGQPQMRPASGRMAVAEAITNLLAAPIVNWTSVKLSVPIGWQLAVKPGEDAALVRHR